jgi:mRNA interferase YafQ
MRTIERSSAFKRDYKRTKATPRHRKDMDSLLSTVVARLLSDQILPGNHRDHALSGDWMGYRECHIKPDLLPIYRKPDADTSVWRGSAHIASYSAEPHPAGFEAVVKMDVVGISIGWAAACAV